jgi:type IV pilus assembly protein PilW
MTAPGLRSGVVVPRALRGLSLIELMVALTIGLIITAAVAQLFATTRSAYTMEENMARVQENGRFAVQFLTQDIRMAGYAGCNSKFTASAPNGAGNCAQGTICSIAQPANSITAFDPSGLKGYKYTGGGTTSNLTDWTPPLPADYFANGDVKPNTDVLVIQRGDDLDTHLTGNTTPDNANVQLLNTATLAGQIQADDVLMVTDCKGGDIIRANNVSTGSGKVTIAHSNSVNTQNNLTHAYGNDAQIMKLVSRAYFIGTGTNGEPALMRRELVRVGTPLQTEELVQGVEDMRLAYGEDTDATPDLVPNTYHDPGSVTNWRNVTTVRVGLLAHTLNKVGIEPGIQQFNLAGTAVGPFGDKLRRSAFNSTIRIRSR